MTYIKVFWEQNDTNYPIEIYSELDLERNEVRKVEFFINNKVGYASGEFSHGGTTLGECSLPSLDEINLDPQFRAQEITRKEFLDIWNKFSLSEG